MNLGEVCILTDNVVTMSNFYRALLEVDGYCDDPVHQTIIAEETMLTIYNDGSINEKCNQNMVLSFTVEDIGKAYQKLLRMGIEVIEGPTVRPWGAENMSFYDPDKNVVYLRKILMK